MGSVSATAARRDLYNIIERVNDESTPIEITNARGKGAVLVGEDDWAAIQETLYLDQIPGMAESLEAGMAEPVDECATADELDW